MRSMIGMIYGLWDCKSCGRAGCPDLQALSRVMHAVAVNDAGSAARNTTEIKTMRVRISSSCQAS